MKIAKSTFYIKVNQEDLICEDCNVPAKYEDMIKKAKHNVDLYLETGKNYTDISLSYDVKNYLPKALKEIERLNKKIAANNNQEFIFL